MTALPVSPLRKGFGFMGIDAILDLDLLSVMLDVRSTGFFISVQYHRSLFSGNVAEFSFQKSIFCYYKAKSN